MLNGLDLFSGIGGIGLALEPWVRTVAYCEQDRYAQGVLLSRMQSGDIDRAPIWDDVRTLRKEHLPRIDIIYGGFPCQDISVAGRGAGLMAGERSVLYFEIERLVRETNPRFVFLENVPAIRTRGLAEVAQSLTELRYDCRWTIVSAAEVGAPHLRKRWFMLASKPERIAPDHNGLGLGDREQEPQRRALQANAEGSWEKRRSHEVAYANGSNLREQSGRSGGEKREGENVSSINGENRLMADPIGKVGAGLFGREKTSHPKPRGRSKYNFEPNWWSIEPDVGRVANGVSNRIHRIKCLGNSVVPAQARKAFMKLLNLTTQGE